MNTTEFLSVRMSDEDGTVVATVEGEIDIASSPALHAQLEQVEPHRHVVLDLAGVSFMDSTALKVFLSEVMTRQNAGGTLRIRECSAAVRRVLEITALDQLLLQPDPSLGRT